jgi:hypothetical protein
MTSNSDYWAGRIMAAKFRRQQEVAASEIQERLTEAEKIKLFNERVAAGLNPNTGEPLGEAK